MDLQGEIACLPKVRSKTARRTAVVTGAGGGIGGAVAEQLLASGYRVYGLDLRYPQSTDSGGEFSPISADVAEPDECCTALSSFEGPIDVLVNAAGVRPSAPVEDTTLKEWKRCLDINLTACFVMTQLSLPRMSRGSHIVNIASAAAYGKRNLGAYGASKAGLISLSKITALELSDRGIRVNAVLPGTTETPMLASIEGASDPKSAPRNFGGTPLDPKEIAVAVNNVIANEVLTGAVIPLGLLPSEW